MYFRTTILSVLGIVASASALDLGTWSFYCGDSCSGGTLIATGDYTYTDFADCTALDQSYAYCYLECDGVCEDNVDVWYEAVTYKSATCLATENSDLGQLHPGECLEGPWESYFVKLNL